MAQDLATRYASDIEEELKRLKEEQSSSLSGGKSGRLKRSGGSYAAVKAENERAASDDSGDGRTFARYAAAEQPQYQQQYSSQPTYVQYPQPEGQNQGYTKEEADTQNQILNAGINAGITYGANALFGGGAAAAAAAPATTATAASIPAATAPAGWTASAAGTAAPTAGGASSTIAAVAPWLAAAAIAYMSYQTYKGRTKIKKAYGTDLTSEEMGQTAPYTSAWFANKLGGFGRIARDINPLYQIDKMVWGSTKSDEQLYRDRARNQWKKFGVVDENYQLKLADGSTFDMGKDGGATLTNADGTTRRYKDIDWNNKLAADSVPDVNPLGYLLTAGVGKDETSSEVVGYFVNAVTANAKDRETVDNNIRDLYKRAGFQNRQQAHASLDGLVEAGRLEKDAAEAFKANVNKYLPDAQQEQPQEQTRSDYLEIPEEPKMSKRRMNSRVDFGFAPSGPRAGGASTGVNEYLNMLNNMNRGRNG